MATVYVSSVDGNDADTGADWANAKQTISGALAICVDATNTIYVDSNHNFVATSASITWNMPNDGDVRIISTDRVNGGILAGATNTVDTNAFSFTIGSSSFKNTYYFYGITIIGAAGTSSSNLITIGSAISTSDSFNFVNCTITSRAQNTSGGFGPIVFGGTNGASNVRQNMVFKNCVFNLSNNAAHKAFSIRSCYLMFHNCTLGYSGAAKPVVLFGASGGSSQSRCRLFIVDCDFSGYDSTSGAYFDLANLIDFECIMRNCKLSATPSLTTGTFPTKVGSITLINTDTGDTKNVFEFRNVYGTITESTSIYANNGGKFDGSGLSWQIVTTSACSEDNPLICPWLMRWVEATSSINVGFRIVHDSATDLHDRNLWSEIEYVSNASFPQGTMLSSRNANPFTGTSLDWTNDSETWTGTGGFGNPNTQTVQSTFTPSEKSLIRGRLVVGVASKTLYLDPLLRVSSQLNNGLLRWTNEGSFNVEPVLAGSVFGGSVFK